MINKFSFLCASAIPERHCTDVGWMMMYLAYSAFVIYIAVLAWPKGQPQALLRLPDWQGVHCGLGESNRNKSLLFFCPQKVNPSHLQIWYPICVRSCPDEGAIIECPLNLKHTTTTTTTTTANFYLPIQKSMNGGLPVPPYPIGGYGQYPPKQSFQYPFYQAQQNYPPMIYPPPGGSPYEAYSPPTPPGAQSGDPWFHGFD